MPRHIYDLSAEEMADLVKLYLYRVNINTRKSFIAKVKPAIEEHSK